MATELLAGVLAIGGLLCLSAFFSASEISIFSLEAHRIESMAAHGGPGTATLARLRDDPHNLLVTILVGNNFVNIAIGAITTALFVTRFSAGQATVLSTIVASSVVLLFGEIAPKSYGVANAESVAPRLARPLVWIQRGLYPLVVVFDAANTVVSRVLGGARDIERPYVTREEIEALVATAQELGVIDVDEEALIQRVFRFTSIPARHVMTPRADVVSVDHETTVEEAIDACATHRVSRLPVSRRTEDHVVGYVDLRDLVDAPADLPVAELVLPVLHVFEGREIDDVLAEFQAEQLELAIVFDQFGALEGLMTIEDVVEEIVGNVFDVGEPRPVVTVDEGVVQARGDAPVAAVNDRLGTDLPAPESGTVAALVVAELGHVPAPGESARVEDVRLTVQSVLDNRILRVLVEREPSLGT